MAQTYTLEEAAQRLGVTPDVLKRRLKEDWKNLRVFRDGATIRFRTTDVEELARSLGEVSDPSLQLAPLPLDLDPPSSGEFRVASRPPEPVEEPLIFDLSANEISLDDPNPTPGKGDSDVRLDEPKSRSRSQDPASIATEEVDFDLAGPGSAIIREGSAARLTPPKSSTKLSASDSNKNLNQPNLADSSEFELSLDGDSDDFELQINADSSDDEVIIGDLPAKKPGDSGINLRDPKDSGINLEKKKGPVSGIKPASSTKLGKQEPDLASDEFELSLDPPASGKLDAGKSGRIPPISDSDSEFELSLDDPSGDDSLMHAALPDSDDKNDIFETDFEIPPLESDDDSSSEVRALADEDSDTDTESSDFDLALDSSDIEVEDESASQVVLLEDEDSEEAPVARRKGKPADDEDEDVADVDVEVDESEAEVEVEEEDGVAGALQGVRGKSRYDEDEDEDEEEEDEDAAKAAPAAATPWGVLPAVFLAPAFLVMLFGSLVGFEMLQSMWGYHQPRAPGAPIVRGVADMFGMDIKDQ